MEKKKTLREAITSLDKYGEKIEMQYQSKKTHTTYFGGLISILNVLLLIAALSAYGAELFLKEKPVTNFAEESIRQPEQWNLTTSTFSFAFGMQDPNTYNQFIDETIYTIKAVQNSMVKVYNSTTQQYDQIWNSTDLGPYPCQQSFFEVPGSLDYFQQLAGFNQMYCFDQSDNKAWMAGDFEADYFGNIEIMVFQCQNKTQEEAASMIQNGQSVVICQSQDIIDSYLMNGYLAAYFTDKVINPKLLDNPFTQNPRDIFWPTSNKLVKELTMYWRNIYIDSDIGIFQTSMQHQRDVVYSYQTEQISYGQNNQFIDLILRFEKAKQTRIYRNYMKIEDVLAQVSGVMDVVVIISTIICLRISKLDLNQNLVNQVYSFEGSEEEPSNQDAEKRNEKNMKEMQLIMNINEELNLQSKGRSISMQNDNNQRNDDSIAIDQHCDSATSKKKLHSEILSQYIKSYKKTISSNMKPSEEKGKQSSAIEKLFSVTNEIVHLNFYEQVMYYIFPFKISIQKKKKQIDYGSKLLEKHLDVMNLINKLQEVDKLKMLLLSDDQLKLFEYLPKPTIKESDMKQQEESEMKKSLQQQQQEGATLQNNNNNNQQQAQQASTNQKQNNQTEKFNMLYMDERSQIEKAADAYSAFENLRKQRTKSLIDTKLLSMLDPKMLDYFLDEKEKEHYYNQLAMPTSNNSPNNDLLNEFQAYLNNQNKVSIFAKSKVEQQCQQETIKQNSESLFSATDRQRVDSKSELESSSSQNHLFISNNLLSPTIVSSIQHEHNYDFNTVMKKTNFQK